MPRKFHHTGVITDQPQPGEIYVAATKVWVTDPQDHPYKIEFLRFEHDTPVKGLVRDRCHVAYTVDNLEAAMGDSPVLLGPFDALEGLRVVFVEEEGVVVEYMHFSGGRERIGQS